MVQSLLNPSKILEGALPPMNTKLLSIFADLFYFARDLQNHFQCSRYNICNAIDHGLL